MVDTLRIAHTDAVSVPTIRRSLQRDGRPVTYDVVLGVCDELVRSGVLVCTSALGVYLRRYRLIEPAAEPWARR